jgi:ectoine hydroxylase
MVVTEEDVYPSRIGDTPQILPRQEPVVYGLPAEQGGGPLDAATLNEFEDRGFLYFPGFFSDAEVQGWRDELQRLCLSESIKQRPEAIVEPESDELRSLFRVHEISPLYQQLAADRRLVSMMSQILGSDVYVHQSRVNLKPGFAGKEFYWHSDFETWHVEDGMPRMRAVSCSILLTPNTVFNGPLMLVPGSHKHYITCVGTTPEDHYTRSLQRQELGVPDPESLKWLAEQGGIEAPTGEAGSLLIFDCNTMHGSNSNISPFPRSNLFFVYNSVENKVRTPYCGLRPRPEYIASREHCEPILGVKG